MNAVLCSDRTGSVLTLTLNRPAARNALNRALTAELHAAICSAAADPAIRCVVLTGTPPAFCAGLDLQEVAAAPGDTYDTGPLAALYDALAGLDRPTIAALNGPGAAGGAGLACACDFVLAAASATLAFPGVPQGLVAPVIVPGLIRRVGDLRARALLLTGHSISAAEARSIGLVTEVVPDDELPARTRSLAAELAALPAEALAETKRLLADSATDPARRRTELRLTPAARAALARYRDQRGP